MTITLGGQWLRYVIQIATLVLLSRLLSAADYGVMAMVTAVVGVAGIIGDFGLSMAAIQRVDLNRRQASNLFWINVAIGGLLGLGVLLIGPLLVSFYHEPALAGICAVMAPTFLLSGISAQFRAETTRSLKFRWLSIVDVSAQAAGLVVAASIAFAGGGYWALVSMQVTLSVANLVLLTIASGWRPLLPQRTGGMKSLLTFGGSTVATQAVNYTSSNLDYVLIGRDWGSADLGVYTRAFQIFALPLDQLAAPLTRVALPILSRLSDSAQYIRYIRRSQLVLSYLLVGVLAGCASTAAPLLSVVLGPQWVGGAIYLQILAIGGTFQALGYVYYWIFLSKGKMAILFWCELSGRLLMVGMLIVLVPLSPVFAAISVSSGLFAIWLTVSILGLRRVDIPFMKITAPAIRPLTLYTTMYIVVQLARLGLESAHITDPLTTFITLALVCVAWVSLSLFFRPIKNDIATIVSTAKLVRKL
ncbi:lipopolysaccharide biosynthesis protein [Subtercola sp. RTI3]|uniref:lipopolysaccharide biosynthesis protein n=1 Tax=Subtercola sp. RTI3 TaxID=3048639 RepID=UPI002B223614|nr:lipopolysaccharide biosynthesis protein [Subtercola sp. RTI3]MEA9986519.1 lipopolysaccharide biosynthesis protein [Subtercola sp. RTI3]